MNVACQGARCGTMQRGIYGRHGLYFFGTYIYVSETSVQFSHFNHSHLQSSRSKSEFNSNARLLWDNLHLSFRCDLKCARLRNTNWLLHRLYVAQTIEKRIYLNSREFEIQVEQRKASFIELISTRFQLCLDTACT